MHATSSILSHAADYGGARARRVSPFVLEALDLPAAAGVPGAGARRPRRLERLGDVRDAPPASRRRAEGPITEPLSLSFYQIDDYLTCPLKYKFAHVLRVPLAPHHAIIYGAALHKAVQLFHHRHAKGHVMSEAELDEVFDSAWSNEGFMSRDHEEARLAAGRAALRRFRAAQLEPDAVIPTYVEREFSFTLGGDRVRGRWDRVDVVPIEPGVSVAAVAAAPDQSADVVSPTLGMLGPERVTITDYKSSDVLARRHALMVFISMFVVFALGVAVNLPSEQHGSAVLRQSGVNLTQGSGQSGGNMSDKEVRFGQASTSVWTVATSDASNGSVNGGFDAQTPAGGAVPLVNLFLGEVIFGGVGSGLYGMFFYIVIAVFVAG